MKWRRKRGGIGEAKVFLHLGKGREGEVGKGTLLPKIC